MNKRIKKKKNKNNLIEALTKINGNKNKSRRQINYIFKLNIFVRYFHFVLLIENEVMKLSIKNSQQNIQWISRSDWGDQKFSIKQESIPEIVSLPDSSKIEFFPLTLENNINITLDGDPIEKIDNEEI